jgi:phage terminase small subunit
MNPKDPITGLPIRLQAAATHFIAETIIGNNLNYRWTQALRDAGYSEQYATSQCTKLSKKVEPLIEKARKNVEANALSKGMITADKLTQGFLNIAFPPEGVQVRNADRLRAMENLAKHIPGYFNADAEVTDEQQRKLTEAQTKTLQEFGEYIMRKRIEAYEQKSAEPAQQAQLS